MVFDFFYIGNFTFLSVLITCILFILSFSLSVRLNSDEKLLAYECGFDPFDEARGKFDVRFYLTAILFIIFDLEISYLFPWGVDFYCLPMLAWDTLIFFLLVLTVGFIYEWQKGALDWE